MSATDLLIIAVGAFLFWVLLHLHRLTVESSMTMTEKLENIIGEVGKLKNEIERIQEKLCEIENNTLSEVQKERRTFHQAPNLTLSEARSMKQGETVHLISGSYYYPSHELYVVEFDYKHSHLQETRSERFGYEVHGFCRFSPDQEWSPYLFFVSEKEALTHTCEGSIRRLW